MTSERITLDSAPNAVAAFHLAAYAFALEHTEGLRVLDVGCGTGYGTALIAATASEVVGIDVSPDAIEHARWHHQADNLRFQRLIPGAGLPFAAASFDAVLCFQVIEHVPNATGFVGEIRRVLTRDGVALITTPYRAARLFPGQRPWNPHHVTEYDTASLSALLAPVFSRHRIAYMAGEAARSELRRGHRLRIATLPVTFPGIPEEWRQRGLTGLQKLRDNRAVQQPTEARGAVVITHRPRGAVHLVAEARP